MTISERSRKTLEPKVCADAEINHLLQLLMVNKKAKMQMQLLKSATRETKKVLTRKKLVMLRLRRSPRVRNSASKRKRDWHSRKNARKCQISMSPL